MKNNTLKRLNRGRSILSIALPHSIFILLSLLIVFAGVKNYGNKINETSTSESIKSNEEDLKQSQFFVNVEIDVGKNGEHSSIKLDGKIIEVKDIKNYLFGEIDQRLSQNQGQLVVLLKASETVPMGMVTDVIRELRKANAKKIIYSSSWKSGLNPC